MTSIKGLSIDVQIAALNGNQDEAAGATADALPVAMSWLTYLEGQESGNLHYPTWCM